MLDLNEIEEEIFKLENSECTSYNVCQKLATLYIVRDHYNMHHMEEPEGEMPPMMDYSIPAPVSPMMPPLK